MSGRNSVRYYCAVVECIFQLANLEIFPGVIAQPDYTVINLSTQGLYVGLFNDILESAYDVKFRNDR